MPAEAPSADASKPATKKLKLSFGGGALGSKAPDTSLLARRPSGASLHHSHAKLGCAL